MPQKKQKDPRRRTDRPGTGLREPYLACRICRVHAKMDAAEQGPSLCQTAIVQDQATIQQSGTVQAEVALNPASKARSTDAETAPLQGGRPEDGTQGLARKNDRTDWKLEMPGTRS